MPYFSENFGVNQFSVHRKPVEVEKSVRIFLRGFAHSQSVLLVGLFLEKDDARTLEMHKIENGWEKQLDLEPGKYFYHFSIDNKKYNDPDNKLSEADHTGTIRSVLFVPNYCFELEDFTHARKVCVAGNFNSWHSDTLEMYRSGGVWQLPIYLKNGTYSYKFIVDGHWITDPQNPILHPDGEGNYNSYISIGPVTVFRLYDHLDAHEVRLAGNFNLWDYTELFMKKTESGWELQYALSQGIYEYKFIVDGEWITDPVNPYSAIRPYGVNSLVCCNPNHVFKLEGYPNVDKVIVSGSFNNWDNMNYMMVKTNEIWHFPICLIPGEYSYIFFADGKPVRDPKNQNIGRGPVGSDCSLLIIENG